MAHTTRKELLKAGKDTSQIQERILGLRRALRDGPNLQADEILDDGRYVLLEVVGRGGFGVVWKAWDEEAEKLVAVKMLHSQWS